MGMSAELSKGDILQLVNIIWDSSFDRVVTNMKAIRERGWNPANLCLLTDPDIMKTRIVESTTTNTTTATDSTSDSIAVLAHTIDSTTTNTFYGDIFKLRINCHRSSHTQLCDHKHHIGNRLKLRIRRRRSHKWFYHRQHC